MPFDGESAPLSAAAVVTEMERLLTEKGWIKGAWESDGGYCLIGALNVARGLPADEFEEGDDLWSPGCADPITDLILRHVHLVTGCQAVAFNDHPHTRKRDVLDLLARIRVRLEKKQNAV